MKNDEMSFKEFKKEILKRARIERACYDQYVKAEIADNFESLFGVIKDNYLWCVIHKVIDVNLLLKLENKLIKTI
jgi:hypothetical protein